MKIQTQKSRKKKVFILVGAAILLLVAVAGGYYYYQVRGNRDQSESPAENTNSGPIETPDSNETRPTTSDNVPEEQLPENVNPSTDIQDYKLITENEKFKIRQLNNDYTITLYPIINNPDQYAMYQSQLKQYKDEALQYLKKQGVDTSKVKIIYEPEEATDL